MPSLPKPYYEEPENGIMIYHGDCREILPHLDPVDLVLTDPPYGVGKSYHGYTDTDNELMDLIASSWKHFIRLADRIILTPGIGNISKYPPAKWVICWNKPNAMTRSAISRANIWEPILVYGVKANTFGVDAITVSMKANSVGLDTEADFDLGGYIRQGLGLYFGRPINSAKELTEEEIDDFLLSTKEE